MAPPTSQPESAPLISGSQTSVVFLAVVVLVVVILIYALAGCRCSAGHLGGSHRDGSHRGGSHRDGSHRDRFYSQGYITTPYFTDSTTSYGGIPYALTPHKPGGSASGVSDPSSTARACSAAVNVPPDDPAFEPYRTDREPLSWRGGPQMPPGSCWMVPFREGFSSAPQISSAHCADFRTSPDDGRAAAAEADAAGRAPPGAVSLAYVHPFTRAPLTESAPQWWERPAALGGTRPLMGYNDSPLLPGGLDSAEASWSVLGAEADQTIHSIRAGTTRPIACGGADDIWRYYGGAHGYRFSAYP